MKNLFLISLLCTVVITGCKKDKPATEAALTTTAISGITSNTATTGGNITSDGRAAITKRGVCWAAHTGPTVGDSITSDGTGSSSFTSNLTGLLANTTYYVRAYAINTAGTAYGNEVSFTTSKGLPTVTTAAISNSIALSVTSGGNILSDGGHAVTSRGVVWSTTAHPTIADSKTTDGTGTGNFTSIVTPLASQTVYYIRAYATTSFGTSYGNEITLTAASSNSLADIDGNVYGTITIGTQTWMTSNLKVTHYRNGDPITNGLTGYIWYADTGYTTTAAYTFPNGDSINKTVYGLLYNSFAVNDPRLIAPAGWHIPTDAEWATLEIFEGMPASIANSRGFYPRGTISPLLQVGGSSGLNLQLAGAFYVETPASYYGFGIMGDYSTSTIVLPVAGNEYREIYGPNDPNYLSVTNQYGSDVNSVRCVKD